MNTPILRTALISEHAWPLACIDGVVAGGQNGYAGHSARCLAAAGHRVDVPKRRRDRPLQRTVEPLSRHLGDNEFTTERCRAHGGGDARGADAGHHDAPVGQSSD